MGALAVEQVVAQLHRNDFGPSPRAASAVSVPPLWVEGPTLRPIAGAAGTPDPAMLAFPPSPARDRMPQAG